MKTDRLDVKQKVMIEVSSRIELFRCDAQRGQLRNWQETITHGVMFKRKAKVELSALAL